MTGCNSLYAGLSSFSNLLNHGAQCAVTGYLVFDAFEETTDPESIGLSSRFYMGVGLPSFLLIAAVVSRIWKLCKRDLSTSGFANPVCFILSANISMLVLDLKNRILCYKCIIIFAIVQTVIVIPLSACLIRAKRVQQLQLQQEEVNDA